MSDMTYRRLGRTGLDVSVIGFGGGHFARPQHTEQHSVRLVQQAIDAGITFLDNAWEYWNGESERRMGLALTGRRDRVTLMTKVCARDRQSAEQQLHDSLRRLKTDVIDVWQFHEINYDNDPEWIFAPGGAIEAAEAARQAGKIRFIGFTGHKNPLILRKMLEQDFEWDTCQLPINVADYHFRSFQQLVLPELKKRDIGIIGMKSLAGDAQLIHCLGLTATECRRYALSQGVSTLVAGIETDENLQQDLAIARSHQDMSAEEQAELRERVRDRSGDGRFEWFKTVQFYDSPLHARQHNIPHPGFSVEDRKAAIAAQIEVEQERS